MQDGMENSVVSNIGSMYGPRKLQLKAPALAKRMALSTFAPPSFHQMNSWRCREDECREQVFGCESIVKKPRFHHDENSVSAGVLSDFFVNRKWSRSSLCSKRTSWRSTGLVVTEPSEKKHLNLPLRKEKPRLCAHVAVEQLAFPWVGCDVPWKICKRCDVAKIQGTHPPPVDRF